jgi:hypothetical protein
MNAPDDRDWLDEVLTEGLRDEITENGFPRRVLAALPPRAERGWLRPLILLVTSLTACLVGLFLLPAGQYLTETVLKVFSPAGWTNLAMGAGSLTLLVGLLWLAYAAANAEA